MSAAKVIPIAEAKTAEPDWPAVVDRFGLLAHEIDWNKVSEYNKLRKQIADRFEDEDASRAYQLHGTRYTAEISARGFENSIVSMPKVKKALGLKVFLEHCSFTLKALKDLLPGSAVDELTVREQTGYRRVSVAARAALPEAG